MVQAQERLQMGVAVCSKRVESNVGMVEECLLRLDVTQDRKRNWCHSGVSRITSSVSCRSGEKGVDRQTTLRVARRV